MTPRGFRSPQYDRQSDDLDRADYRSTIYWNPRLVTESGSGAIIFFAADLETIYRIEVEGLTKNGRPVRAVKYITVRNQ